MSPCPHLPPAPIAMDATALTKLGPDRGQIFYLTALTYAQFLWTKTRAARATLALDRAFGADLTGNEPVLQSWPLPYAAMTWFLAKTPPDVFIGNPRVHFQHLADRMNEPRRDQRRWRAWACWALARRLRPDWPADPKHKVIEPTALEIEQRLATHGIPGEAALWKSIHADAIPTI